MENIKIEEIRDRLARVDILLDDVSNLLKLLNNHLEDEIPIANVDKQKEKLSIDLFIANSPMYSSLIHTVRAVICNATKDVTSAIHIAYGKDGGER